MKHSLCLSLALLLCSCQSDNASGQSHSLQSETTYPREKIVSNDRFDFDEFRKLRATEFAARKAEWEKNGGALLVKEENFYPVHQILPDGTNIEITPPLNDPEQKEKCYWVKIIPPPPALFETIKCYRSDGIISKVINHIYVGEMYPLSGITQIYDQNGILEKTVNDDKRYAGMIDVDALLQILVRNKLLNPYDGRDRKSYLIMFDEKRMIWHAEHHTGYVNGDLIEIDAMTGNILSKKHFERDDSHDYG